MQRANSKSTSRTGIWKEHWNPSELWKSGRINKNVVITEFLNKGDKMSVDLEQILRSDWIPEPQDGPICAAWDFRHSGLARKSSLIDQACSLRKLPGCCPFFCCFNWSILCLKRRTSQIFSYLDLTLGQWSIVCSGEGLATNWCWRFRKICRGEGEQSLYNVFWVMFG